MARYVSVFEDAEIPDGATSLVSHPSKRELAGYVRAHTRTNLYDESGAAVSSVAIYCLSDPRNIRDVRYIGQTRAPPSRFLQHVHTARLWLPDALPWWVKAPQLRPLYSWIRELYADERRLPVMVVTAWAASPKQARAAERERIIECLKEGRDLFNIDRHGAANSRVL